MSALYEPGDCTCWRKYKEATTGTSLEEGDTEAGNCPASRAGEPAYSPMASKHRSRSTSILDVRLSQRVRATDSGAAADMAAKGFLIGGTAGSGTTLQPARLARHPGRPQTAQTQSPSPTWGGLRPRYTYELEVIILDGHEAGCMENAKPAMYYLMAGTKTYVHPRCRPRLGKNGIVPAACTRFAPNKDAGKSEAQSQLFGQRGPSCGTRVAAADLAGGKINGISKQTYEPSPQYTQLAEIAHLAKPGTCFIRRYAAEE